MHRHNSFKSQGIIDLAPNRAWSERDTMSNTNMNMLERL